MSNSDNVITAITHHISEGDWEDAAIILMSVRTFRREKIASAVDGMISRENSDRWMAVVHQVIDAEEIFPADDNHLCVPVDTHNHVCQLIESLSDKSLRIEAA